MNIFDSQTADVVNPSVELDSENSANSSSVTSDVDQDFQSLSSKYYQLMMAQRDTKLVDSAFPDPQSGTREEPHSGIPDAISGNWAGLAKSKISRKSYGRILQLAIESRDAHQAELRQQSLSSFLSFWATIRVMAPEPELTLARNGNLVAEWHRNWNRHLDIEFKEDGLVLYGMLLGKIVNQGRDTADALARRLVDFGSWPI